MNKGCLADFKDILWSRKLKSLDYQKDKNYIIHQVLSLGTLDQLKQLFNCYPKKEVSQTFLNFPKKNYTPASFNFIKNYVLKLKNKKAKKLLRPHHLTQ